MKRNIAGVGMANQARVSEDVTRGWYEDGPARHPYEGETKPLQKNPKYRPGDGKYTWFKAPRYDGEPCEVGPLARVLVAYARGHKDIKPVVDNVLKTLGVDANALFSTLGRTAARGIESLAIGEKMQTWVMELVANIKNGDTQTYEPYEMPGSGMGVGLNDVPRGALGHWVNIENKKIKNLPVRRTVNLELMPRAMPTARLGPVEEALIGTPVADPKRAA